MMTLESLTRLHAGDPVSELAPDLERHAAKIRSLGHEHSISIQNLLCQIAAALREPVDRAGGQDGPPPSPLIGRFYDERRDLPARLEALDASVVFHHYLAKLMLCVFLGDPAGAVGAARAGRRHVRGGGFANYLVAVFMTYESLALLTAPRTRGTRGALRRAHRNQRVLERLAGGAAMNFAHRHHLVAAELCRARGQGERATEHFERAIELAQRHGYVHDAGLAQERAAAFNLERGLARLGREYLRDAHRSYRRWGADAVVRRLEAEHASEFQILAANRDAPSRRAERFADSLDYRMLLKSSQAISGEILLPRLLERLLQNILAHAGAQRAVLVLESRGELRVEAEASVDDDRVQIVGGEPVDDSERLCRGIVHYAARMTAPVVLGDASRAGLFVADPYVRARQPRSVLCTPVLHQSKLIGAVYLENNRVSHVFTEACLEVVNLLAAQAAISITNAKLHALELEAQQAKINPHFLFNALSSIADLAVSDGPTAETAIVKLAGLYRYILTSSAGERVTLEQEFAIVESYLTLEKLRYGAKLDYEVTAEPAAHRVRLPGLLIQPLVENAIRHGVAPKLGPGVVTVHAAVRGDRCCIVVQDDGDGGKASASGTGFGLRSIQERLALAYGQRFSFAISRTGGYRVEIEIPAVV
jgi:GAF domain-containing protein